MDGNGNGEVSQESKDDVAEANKAQDEHNEETKGNVTPNETWTGDKSMPKDQGDWNGPPGEWYTHQLNLPPVPKPGGQSGAPMQVSTEALKQYAGNLRLLIDPLKDLRSDLQKVVLKPGSFFDAQYLVTRVVGDTTKPGLVTTTLKFLDDAIRAISVVADQLEDLAGAYKSAEELNAATGKDVADYIENAKSVINKTLGTGNAA